MAASEVATVSGTVIQIATAIQGLGNNWYEASADWEDFPRKIARLQRKYDIWRKVFTNSDMLSESLAATLREAKELLEQEEAKLKRRQRRFGAGWWSKVSRTMFPAQVGLRIQVVIDAFEEIPAFLQMEEDALEAGEKKMIRTAPSLPFRDDYRYVPLEATESEVRQALDNPGGSPVVLLYGGPGKGKTCLAGHLGLHYERTCKNPGAPFEQVVFLECGPKANILTSQLKLTKLLGSDTGATGLLPEQGQNDSNVAIRKRLSRLLNNPGILMILDDVWEQTFLQEMLNLCGVGVKCLVTSQDRDLCRGLTLSHPAIQVQIEDVKEEVAMEILASHVGFTNEQIPEGIEDIARKMIEGTQGNPLALATVARAMDCDRYHELEEWEAASENFLRLLRSSVTTFALGMPYSKSFWLATQLSIQSLTKDAQSLLILLHLCEVPSVPEEVVNIIYHSGVGVGGSNNFELSRAALKSRGLVTISNQSHKYDNSRVHYSWSAHSLQKIFIETEMSADKKQMLERLASPSHGTNVKTGVEMMSTMDLSIVENRMAQMSLCALYFDKQYTQEASLKMGVLPNQLNNMRRSAIEPIIRLLGLPLSKRWTSTAQSSSKRIFLQYIYKSALHESSILELLALPMSVLPMLKALEDVAIVEYKTTLINKNSGALIKALLDLLGNTGDTTKAIAAGEVFKELLFNALHRHVIVSSGILDTIVRILSSAHNRILLNVSCSILIRLTYRDTGNSNVIAQHPRILGVLLKLIVINDSRQAQRGALAVLGNLVANFKDMEFSLKVINYPRALEQIVSMFQCSHDEIPAQAARTVGNLAGPGEASLERAQKIVDCPGCVEYLLKSISNDNDRDLQGSASWAIANLTSTLTPTDRQKIVDYPGALDLLAACMCRDDHPLLQLHAAYALICIDPARGNGARLHSARAYQRRGKANKLLGVNKEALGDLNRANEMEPGNVGTLGHRCAVRALLGDFQGALVDSNIIMEKQHTAFDLQERGVLKRMMGDLSGALADLNESLEVDSDDYEVLKHRGLVRFLMGDEIGAHSDAERALIVQPSRVYRFDYLYDCLGTTSVEFLHYKLR